MFIANSENQALKNKSYRKVVHTTEDVQLTYMSLNVGEDIPLEKHDGTQIFNVVSGRGIVQSGKRKQRLKEGVVVIVPPFTNHYVKNTSKEEPLKLWTIYTPPEHPKDTLLKRQK